MKLLFLLLLLCVVCGASATKHFKYKQSRDVPPIPDTISTEISDVFEISDISHGAPSLHVTADTELSFVAENDDDLESVQFQEPGEGTPFKRLGEFTDRATNAKQRTQVNGIHVSSDSLALSRALREGNARLRTNGNSGKVIAVAKFRNAQVLQVQSEGTNTVEGKDVTVRVRFLDADRTSVCDSCVASATITYGRNQVALTAAASGNSWHEVTFPAVFGSNVARVVATSITGAKRSANLVVAASAPWFAGVQRGALSHDGTQIDLTVALDSNVHHEVIQGKIVELSAGIFNQNGALVCYVSGLSTINADASVVVRVQNEWFDGIAGPFVMKNVYINDQDTQAVLAQVDSMNLDSSFVNAPSSSSIQQRLFQLMGIQAETPEQKLERMTMGRRPAHMKPKKPAMATASSAGSGQHTLLVHGYCSSNVWGSQTGYFSNPKVFLDLDQSRSHSDFAQRIDAFADAQGVTDCRIVAHSQGGMAALHLYTYYWSCLDATSGGRLIQSVGTPYQGTALAGNLAAIGSVFGAGCGSNNDLTYSGASSWLAGIPSWARSAVNYYTTSFTTKWWRYDYCHLATDLFLSDPEDGTTEKAKGQLPGGINRGHKTGWCHTSGMRDPAQVTDGSRNSQMNAYAY